MVLFNILNEWEIVKIKADLLCMGIRHNDVAKEIYHKQNPCDDLKTGNVGLHISLSNGSHVLVTASHSFDQKSPYSLDYMNGGVILLKDQNVVDKIKEVPMPNWYNKKATTKTPMPTIFLHEGEKFLHLSYSGCDYQTNGQSCAFCGTGLDWKIATPEEIGETVSQAIEENPNYHICLGGGTRLPNSSNMDFFYKCLTEIRKINSKVPIWLEMTPPESDDDISRLVDLGATSFGFNIEIWDEDLRKEICPGKSNISKGHYIMAMKKVLEILGKNRVGSCLIVGLEPIKNSIDGATELAAIGVQPCLIPFKPYDKSLFKTKPPCNPDDLIKVSEAAVKAMIKNGISPEKNEGCFHCESCTIDHDIYKLYVSEKRGVQ